MLSYGKNGRNASVKIIYA